MASNGGVPGGGAAGGGGGHGIEGVKMMPASAGPTTTRLVRGDGMPGRLIVGLFDAISVMTPKGPTRLVRPDFDAFATPPVVKHLVREKSESFFIADRPSLAEYVKRAQERRRLEELQAKTGNKGPGLTDLGAVPTINERAYHLYTGDVERRSTATVVGVRQADGSLALYPVHEWVAFQKQNNAADVSSDIIDKEFELRTMTFRSTLADKLYSKIRSEEGIEEDETLDQRLRGRLRAGQADAAESEALDLVTEEIAARLVADESDVPIAAGAGAGSLRTVRGVVGRDSRVRVQRDDDDLETRDNYRTALELRVRMRKGAGMTMEELVGLSDVSELVITGNVDSDAWNREEALNSEGAVEDFEGPFQGDDDDDDRVGEDGAFATTDAGLEEEAAHGAEADADAVEKTAALIDREEGGGGGGRGEDLDDDDDDDEEDDENEDEDGSKKKRKKRGKKGRKGKKKKGKKGAGKKGRRGAVDDGDGAGGEGEEEDEEEDEEDDEDEESSSEEEEEEEGDGEEDDDDDEDDVGRQRARRKQQQKLERRRLAREAAFLAELGKGVVAASAPAGSRKRDREGDAAGGGGGARGGGGGGGGGGEGSDGADAAKKTRVDAGPVGYVEAATTSAVTTSAAADKTLPRDDVEHSIMDDIVMSGGRVNDSGRVALVQMVMRRFSMSEEQALRRVMMYLERATTRIRRDFVLRKKQEL